MKDQKEIKRRYELARMLEHIMLTCPLTEEEDEAIWDAMDIVSPEYMEDLVEELDAVMYGPVITFEESGADRASATAMALQITHEGDSSADKRFDGKKGEEKDA